MARVTALALWAVLMAAMWLFVAWGMDFKKNLEALGAPASRPQLVLIMLIDWLTNYYYVPAVGSLLACLAVPGGKSPRPRSED